MPRLLSDQISFTPLGKYVPVVILMTSAIAVVLLWFRHSSILDLWLIVTLCALILHMANNIFLIPGRFSAGWYSSRFFSVIVSTVVLSVLLSETSRLYGNLSRLVVARGTSETAPCPLIVVWLGNGHDCGKPTHLRAKF